jgi:hypothetical protein
MPDVIKDSTGAVWRVLWRVLLLASQTYAAGRMARSNMADRGKIFLQNLLIDAAVIFIFQFKFSEAHLQSHRNKGQNLHRKITIMA